MFEPSVPYAARAKTGNGIPYLGTRVRIEQDGNQDDQVAEQDGEERLRPVHAGRHESRGEHVGRDAVRHADPERRVVVGCPGSARDRNRREILVVVRAGLDPPGVDEFHSSVGQNALVRHHA